MKFFQRIFSVTVLLALSFALGGKTIHVLTEHHEEEFCGENITHFHEQEHGCFICEFDLQTGDSIQHYEPVFAGIIFFNPFEFFYSSEHVQEFYFSYSSRGPPTA